MSNVFEDDFDDRFDDDERSSTSVTLKLAIIQKRCSELINESDDESDGLSLVDDASEPASDEPDPYDPYGRA
jgi:hypothetical protein